MFEFAYIIFVYCPRRVGGAREFAYGLVALVLLLTNVPLFYPYLLLEFAKVAVLFAVY